MEPTAENAAPQKSARAWSSRERVYVIALFALMETYRRWKNRRSGEEGNAEYYKVKPAHRLAVFAVYIGLIALLVVGMDATFIERDFNDA